MANSSALSFLPCFSVWCMLNEGTSVFIHCDSNTGELLMMFRTCRINIHLHQHNWDNEMRQHRLKPGFFLFISRSRKIELYASSSFMFCHYLRLVWGSYESPEHVQCRSLSFISLELALHLPLLSDHLALTSALMVNEISLSLLKFLQLILLSPLSLFFLSPLNNASLPSAEKQGFLAGYFFLFPPPLAASSALCSSPSFLPAF